MKSQYIIPIFVPHLGCRYDCVFCNQKSISGQTKPMTKDEAKRIIEEHLKEIKQGSKAVEIAFFGGSFTAIEEERQQELLELAYSYIKEKKVDSIRISTRPDAIDVRILKRLKKYKVKTIELGVQSTNDYILKKANRGHTFKDVKKASLLIKLFGFNLGHQMMVGLPESTRIDEINTAKQIIKLRPKIVRIYPVLTIKNTQLEKDYLEGKYVPITLVQAVEVVKDLTKMFKKKRIDVIRIGLQNSNEIAEPEAEGSQVVAGPYHPAFRQLVETALWHDVIVSKIKKFNVKVKEVEVSINPKNVNNVVGHKRENIQKLKEMYDVDLVVKQTFEIKPGKSEIKITKTYKDFMEEE